MADAPDVIYDEARAIGKIYYDTTGQLLSLSKFSEPSILLQLLKKKPQILTYTSRRTISLHPRMDKPCQKVRPTLRKICICRSSNIGQRSKERCYASGGLFEISSKYKEGQLERKLL